MPPVFSMNSKRVIDDLQDNLGPLGVVVVGAVVWVALPVFEVGRF